MTDLAANVARVQARIAAAARRGGRRPEDVTLVAVTKGVDAPQILEAVAAGVQDLGENRVQEAVPKIQALRPLLGRPGALRVRWHLVGHLQRNKVREAVALFTVIHSLDGARLAADVSRRAAAPVDVLLQVNVAGEAQKFGVSPQQAPAVLREIAGLPALHVVGLMTIAPLSGDPEETRPVFGRLRGLRDDLEALGIAGVTLPHLSMGMSGDFEIAVEEGATMVRIGRAIFSPTT